MPQYPNTKTIELLEVKRGDNWRYLMNYSNNNNNENDDNNRVTL